jgi:hypothetical protein
MVDLKDITIDGNNGNKDFGFGGKGGKREKDVGVWEEESQSFLV